MENFVKPLILWLHMHPTWAGLITFLITLFESLAIIGLIIPGSVTLSAIGGLVGSGIVPPLEIFTWAIMGAILGDGVSYWLGYKYHNVIRKVWPFNRFSKLIAKGEVFFNKHGGKGIFIGRFVGPVRPIIPLIAGIMRVRPKKFFTVDIISGILWAPTYMLPGILVGAAAAHFAPKQAVHFLLIFLAFILLILLIIWMSKITTLFLIGRWQRLCQYIWDKVQLRAPNIYSLLREHEHPHLARPLSLSFFTLLFLTLFVILFASYLLHPPWLVHINDASLSFFQSLYWYPLENIAIILSIYLGKNVVILSTSVILCLALLARKDWHALGHFVLLILSSCAVIIIFKDLSHHLRPDVVIKPPTTFSFPSGHTLLGVTIYGYIAFLFGHNKKLWIKKLSYSIAFIIILLIALSRLYLNVHWLSDIVGSLLLGASILYINIIVYRRKERVNKYQPWLLLLLLIVGQLGFGTYYFHKHDALLRESYRLKENIMTINPNTWWSSTSSMLPVYRNNRFNKPVEILNIQWLGSLKAIEQSLVKNGWQKGSRLSYNTLKKQLLGEKVIVLTPLPQQLKNHPPVLLMVKPIHGKGSYIILRLWDDKYRSSGHTVYFGNISYHLPVKQWLWHKHEKCEHVYRDPTIRLKDSLNTWHTKMIRFQEKYKLKQYACINMENQVLLIHD